MYAGPLVRRDLAGPSLQQIPESEPVGVASAAAHEHLRQEFQRLRERERAVAQLSEALEGRLAAVEQIYCCAEYIEALEVKKEVVETHVQSVTSRVEALEKQPQGEEAILQQVRIWIEELRGKEPQHKEALVQLRASEQRLGCQSWELMQQLECLEAQLSAQTDVKSLQAQQQKVEQHAARTEKQLRQLAAWEQVELQPSSCSLREENARLRARIQEVTELSDVLEGRLAALEYSHCSAERVSAVEDRKRELDVHVQNLTSQVEGLKKLPVGEEAILQQVKTWIEDLEQQQPQRDEALLQLKASEQRLSGKSLELMQYLEYLEAQLSKQPDVQYLQQRRQEVEQHVAQTEERLRKFAAQCGVLGEEKYADKLSTAEALADELATQLASLEGGKEAAYLEYERRLGAAQQGVADAQKGQMEFAAKLSKMGLRANSVEEKTGTLEFRIQGLETKFQDKGVDAASADCLRKATEVLCQAEVMQKALREEFSSLELRVNSISPESQVDVRVCEELEQQVAVAEQQKQQLVQEIAGLESKHQEQRAMLQREYEEVCTSFQARIDTLTADNDTMKAELAAGSELVDHISKQHAGHQEQLQQLRNQIASQQQLHKQELSQREESHRQQVDSHRNDWEQKLVQAQRHVEDHAGQVSHHKLIAQGLQEEMAKHAQAAQQQAADHAEQVSHHKLIAQGLQEEMAKHVQAAQQQAADHAEQVRCHECTLQGLHEEMARASEIAQTANRQAAEQAEQHQLMVLQLSRERTAIEEAHRLAVEQGEQHQVAHRDLFSQLQESQTLVLKTKQEKEQAEAAQRQAILDQAELEVTLGRERAAYETAQRQLTEQAAELQRFEREASALQARAESAEGGILEANEAAGVMQQELQDLRARCMAYAVLEEECAELRRQIASVSGDQQQVQSLSQWQQAADAIGANFDAGLAQMNERVSADRQRIAALQDTIHAQVERETQLQLQVRELQEELVAVHQQVVRWQHVVRQDVVEDRSISPKKEVINGAASVSVPVSADPLSSALQSVSIGVPSWRSSSHGRLGQALPHTPSSQISNSVAKIHAPTVLTPSTVGSCNAPLTVTPSRSATKLPFAAAPRQPGPSRYSGNAGFPAAAAPVFSSSMPGLQQSNVSRAPGINRPYSPMR